MQQDTSTHVSDQRATRRRTVAHHLLPAALLAVAACGGGGSPPGPPPPAPTPASIVTQPVAVSVTAGQPAAFSVVASGTAPLAYQWQRNTVDIAGATGATYAIASAALGDNGASFRVVVSNVALAVTSTAALLTVSVPNVAPTIVTPPLDSRVTSPATATFSAVAAGTPTPTLRWQLSTNNGGSWADIPGATLASYTTPATTTGDSFNRFRAIATNIAGTATSPVATLIVDAPIVADRLVLFAGSLALAGTEDGTRTTARFGQPYGVVTDAAGNVYVADRASQTIRKITPAGAVTTLAGLANTEGSADGTGSAARFSFPTGLGVDAAGNVYVADNGNNLLRKITPAGLVTTVVGVAREPGGPRTGGRRLFNPSAVAIDAAGNYFIANTGDHTIVMYPPVGPGVVLAGFPGIRGSQDGTDSTARFNGPSDLVLDGLGNLYVADQLNGTIRKIVIATHVVTTYAGNPSLGGFADGIGGAALFSRPIALTIDAAGNLYVADLFNNVLRKIATGGVVSTVLGVVRSNPTFDFRLGPNPRLGGPLYMTMIDQRHIVLGMDAGGRTALFLATVP